MSTAKGYTDDEGNLHIVFENDKEVVFKKAQDLIITCVCDSNPELFNKICDLVQQTYGDTIRIEKTINSFRQDLMRGFINMEKLK